jgi:hypothetical protein
MQRPRSSKRHPYVTQGSASLAAIAIAGLAMAQCRYPCWSELASDKFTYESFELQPEPPVSLPYEFSFPYPSQPKGASSAECNAQENPNVDLYRYDSKSETWTGPLSGPIYRNPTYLQVTQLTSGWKGIAVQVSYEGKVDSSTGHTLVESVFFHNERCYRASTEFGFSHYVKGLAGDDKIYFYYEINANCQPKGKCRLHGTQDALTDTRVNVPIPIPSEPNSQGGSDWLYEAYLIDSGAKWHIRVVDPHKLKTRGAPIDHDVHDFFQDIARDYAAHGADGYVTATATRDGALEYSSHPPVMNVVKIYAAK